MRALFSLLVLGLATIGAHASSLEQSNLTYFGAPRLALDGVPPHFDAATTAANLPSCGKSSGTASRRVAYYQSWNSRRRDCDKVLPSQLDLNGITHLVLAFATIDPKTFQVGFMNKDDEDIYKQFLALPDNVSKWIGIGGFEFSDPGATRHTWSDMTSTKDNRKAFIDSLKQFMSEWQFKGVDIDWEWPGHEGRGGKSQDGQNQVELVKEMRQALGNYIGLGVVLPAQYDYMSNMDPKGLEAHVDWLGILTYDLHGQWDKDIPGLGPKIKPHTDLKEIDTALNLLWSKDIDSKKVNLGLANYGRGYTVAEKDCMYYGCTFTGPSKMGSCTLQEGILSTCEIRRLISDKKLNWKVIAGGAEVNEVTWDDQWIGFDDAGTLGKKLELANNRCLGGTALWAIDYSTCPSDGGSPQPPPPGSSMAPSQSASVPASSIASSGAPPNFSSQPSSAPSPSQGNSAAPPPPKSSSAAPSSAAPSSAVTSQQGSSRASSSSPAPAPSSVPSSAVPPASSDGSSAPPSAVPSSAPWTSSVPSSGNFITQSSAVSSVQGPSQPGSSGVPTSSGASTSSVVAPSSSGGAPTVVVPVPIPSAPSNAQSSQQPSSQADASNPASSTSQASSSTAQPSSGPVSSASSEIWSSSAAGSSSSSVASTSSAASSGVQSSSSAAPGTPSSVPASSQAGVSSAPTSPGASSQASSSAWASTWSNAPIPSSASGSSAQGSSTPVQFTSGAPASSSNQQSSTPNASSVAPSGSSGGSSTAAQSTSGAPQSSNAPASSSGNQPSGSSAAQSSDAPASSSGNQASASSAAQSSNAPASSSGNQASESSAAQSSNAATSGGASTSAAASATTSAAVKPSSSNTPDGVLWCPSECRGVPWCDRFCGGELSDIPPPECWLFDWCWIWWGYPRHKRQEKDGKKCKLLGCDCGWMGLPWGPGCPIGKIEIPFWIKIVIELIGLFPDPCKFWGCDGNCGVFGCDGFCFGEEGCTACPKEICPKGDGPKRTGPIPTPIPTNIHPPNPPNGKPKKCEPQDYKTATERYVMCGEFVSLSSAVSATTISTWVSTKVTTATSSSSSCSTWWDIPIIGCNVEDHLTTKTVSNTKSNSISSETPGPACTRAPLSLDDDEGDNIGDPRDGFESTSMFGNMTDVPSRTSTMFNSTTFTSSAATPTCTDNRPCWNYFDKTCVVQRCTDTNDPEFCAYRCLSDMCLAPNAPKDCATGNICAHPACPKDVMGAPATNFTVTITYPSNGPTKTWTIPASSNYTKTWWATPSSTSSSSATWSQTWSEPTSFEVGTSTKSVQVGTSTPPATTSKPGPMDKNGKWKVKIRLWRTDTAAQLDWTLYDPNGYEAGKGDASSQGKDDVGFYVESKNRIPEHHMPFGVNGWLRDWPKFDDARVQFLIEKTMPNCDYLWKAPCKPSMQTENRLETMMFEVNTCWQYCKNEKDQLVLPSDMNCQDLNDADWYDALDGAKHRAFECFWKGF